MIAKNTQEVFKVSSEAKLAVETLGTFIEERYAPGRASMGATMQPIS